MIDKYEGNKPASLSLFLDYVGLSEEEFYEISEDILFHHGNLSVINMVTVLSCQTTMNG